MQYLGNIKVIPELPESLIQLKQIAYNLYFSWNPEAKKLFQLINPQLWDKLNHNPVKFLREAQQKDLERCANDPSYLSTLKKVMTEFDLYMQEEKTWFKETFPNDSSKTIAYFSAELGFHESLPIYSGGLGVLAGDHLKSASDLGLPIIGVSLFYYQTYFTQQIDAHGRQIALYMPYHPEELPLQLVTRSDGTPLMVSVEVGLKEVKLRIWKAQIGRIKAFLLDTNIPENPPEARLITSRLYGGDQETRISQEIVLGIGGVLALEAMGIQPYAWHMNEGHSVFLALERIRHLVRAKNLKFEEALEAVASNTVFTTHTPVPAGNDAFPLHFVDKYFQRYWESIGIRRYQFMELGNQMQPEGYEIFNLTILSLNLSRFRNGVSQLHGNVSRQLWKEVWHNIPSAEIPITHITNGVHAATWISEDMRTLFREHLGEDWLTHLDEPLYWKGVLGIPNQALWQAKNKAKEKMLDNIRERLRVQMVRNKAGILRENRLKNMLKPDILTIGFARRFATYKRGTLIFRDIERIKRILNNPERPVQLLFAGKAHPRDQGGQELIRQINEISMREDFQGRVFFIEHYDMNLARELVAGVDIWLNNPRRPMEASGTSGQKAGMNAGVNFSVLDGWWCEGYNGKNGFAFGDSEDYQNEEELNTWDSSAIYDILEHDIIPAFYERDKEGLPKDWINFMKYSLLSIIPQFNTHRMVKEYTRRLYLPAIRNGEEFTAQNFDLARGYAKWRETIESEWPRVKLTLNNSYQAHEEVILKYNHPFKVSAKLHLGKINPADVKVQVYMLQDINGAPGSSNHEIVEMENKQLIEEGIYLYETEFTPSDSGKYQYTIRVLPHHQTNASLTELGLIRWFNDPEQDDWSKS